MLSQKQIEEGQPMQRIFVSALVVCVLCAADGVRAGDAQAESSAEVEKLILKMEDELNRAIEKRDISALDRIYGDSLIWMARGDVLNKAQVLDGFRSGTLASQGPVVHDDLKVRVYGDTAVLSGRAKTQVLYNSKVFQGPRRFIQVYLKQNGQWRQVVHAVMENANR
jgi:ketosteroid isomerase-like protein